MCTEMIMGRHTVFTILQQFTSLNLLSFLCDRIIEWFGFEGTLDPIPCHRQEHLPLDQLLKAPPKLALNTPREEASHGQMP